MYCRFFTRKIMIGFMDKLIDWFVSFVCFVLRKTYTFGNKMIKSTDNKSIGCLGLILLVISGILSVRNIFLAMIVFAMVYVLIFITNSYKILLSFRGFFFSGTVYWIAITMAIKYSIWHSSGTSWIQGGYPFILVSWCIYSLIANNKVATAANQVHSTILGLIVIMKDMIIYSLPAAYLNRVTPAGDTYETAIETSFGMIFYPILAINLIALLLCSLKGYWIEKYNDGKDLEVPKPQEAQMPDDEQQNNDLQMRIKK